MKLYASSYRIPNSGALFELFDKQSDEMYEVNVGIINAKDYRKNREAKLHELATFLGDTGIVEGAGNT